MDQPYAGLIARADYDIVDVDVAGSGRHEGDDLGDVLGAIPSSPAATHAFGQPVGHRPAHPLGVGASGSNMVSMKLRVCSGNPDHSRSGDASWPPAPKMPLT